MYIFPYNYSDKHISPKLFTQSLHTNIKGNLANFHTPSSPSKILIICRESSRLQESSFHNTDQIKTFHRSKYVINFINTYQFETNSPNIKSKKKQSYDIAKTFKFLG